LSFSLSIQPSFAYWSAAILVITFASCASPLCAILIAGLFTAHPLPSYAEATFQSKLFEKIFGLLHSTVAIVFFAFQPELLNLAPLTAISDGAKVGFYSRLLTSAFVLSFVLLRSLSLGVDFRFS
jgi:hypothetical protein